MTTRNYSFGTDYGKNLLVDLNQLANAQGTDPIRRDAFQRAHCEITRLLMLQREAFRAGFWAWCGPANEREYLDTVVGEAKEWEEWTVKQQTGNSE